ncbi:MAG: signal peptidase II [Clostridium sp.]
MWSTLWILGLVFLDQVTKYAAKCTFQGASDKVLVDGIFSLTYLENRGAAFGIFKDEKIILIGLTAIVIIALIIYLFKGKGITRPINIALILILGGAIGNLIDRVFLGYVIDFSHFYIGNVFDWPVFNIADTCVVIGTVLMAVSILFSKEK